MKFPVECLLKRPGGTIVDLHGTAYHFKPENDPAGLGRHVCDVPNAKHLQRFMQIPEAYAILDDEPAPAPAPAPAITTPAPVNPQAIGAASAAAPTEPPPVPLAAPAEADTDPVPPAPPPQDDAATEPTTLPPPADALPTVAELEAMELDVLREQAAKEVGREPSPRAKKPLLISQIIAARAEKAA